MNRPAYTPISDYGAIGNTHSAALVSRGGSIDWCCLPRFDSPSVFAAILDHREGGHFQIAPASDFRSEQVYLPGTNVLRATFSTAAGDGILTDFMPCWEDKGKVNAFSEVHRLLRCQRGQVTFQLDFQPRLDYARAATDILSVPWGLIARGGGETLLLTSDVGLTPSGAIFTLRAGEEASFVLRYGRQDMREASWHDSKEKLVRTVAFWEQWSRKCNYQGPWKDAVMRSALTLKLLTYSPTGAIVAAATTSLPEEVGGVRNWDYRYAWLRDSSLTLNALYRLGYEGEAHRFADWVIAAVEQCQCPTDLRVVYAVDGTCDLKEATLYHLEGYRGSRPVRIGNDAAFQEQLDVYGELLDCFHVCRTVGHRANDGRWERLRTFAEHVCQQWKEPDRGIWEIRGQPKNFVFSKVMAWVALERAIQAAREFRLPGKTRRWETVRDAIRRDVLQQGVHPSLRAFQQAYEVPAPDASNLLISLVGFLDAGDVRVRSTVDWVMRDLRSNSGLLYRYSPGNDGLPGGEGAFLACSFWLVSALARMGAREKAQLLLKELLSYSNHLGLYSEEYDPDTKELLGNFPQAFTHVALITAALDLREPA